MVMPPHPFPLPPGEGMNNGGFLERKNLKEIRRTSVPVCSTGFADGLGKLLVVAEIGEVPITVNEVMELTVGDVIKLPDTKMDSEMVLRLGGRKKYKCRPGLIGNRVAIQIGDNIEEIPDELLTSKRSEEDM